MGWYPIECEHGYDLCPQCDAHHFNKGPEPIVAICQTCAGTGVLKNALEHTLLPCPACAEIALPKSEAMISDLVVYGSGGKKLGKLLDTPHPMPKMYDSLPGAEAIKYPTSLTMKIPKARNPL